MAKLFIEESTLTAIGDAIREKTGKEDLIAPGAMPTEIASITTGTEANLIPLTVTENGTYYPTATLEVGKTYTMKSSYTNEELQALYEASIQVSEDGSEAYLQATSDGMIGIINLEGMYAVFASQENTVRIWLPEEWAGLAGVASGWYLDDGSGDGTPTEAPSITIGEMDMLFVQGGLAVLEPLYELNKADGFSEVTVNVAGSGGGTIEGAYTLTFLNYDNSFLFEKQTLAGDDSYNPVTAGKIETPTKESTLEYHYTHNGWSLTNGNPANDTALKNVQEDRTLYAAFAPTYRLYTVRFWDGEELIATEYVRYGETVSTPAVSEKDGFEFLGWSSNDFVIYGDADYYTQWKEISGFVLLGADTNISLTTIRCVAYCPTKNHMAIYEANTQCVHVYDTTNYPYTKLFTTSKLSAGSLSFLQYSNDGKYLMGGSTTKTFVLDTANSPYTTVNSISVSKARDGSFIPGTSDIIIGYDSQSFKAKRHPYTFGTAQIQYGTVASTGASFMVAIDKTGTKMAVAGSSPSCGDTAAIYNIGNGERDSACPVITTGFSKVAFDYSGRYAMFFPYSGNPTCYDTSTSPYTQVEWTSLVDVYNERTSSSLWSSRQYEYLFYQSTNNKLVAYDTRQVPFRYVEDFPEITQHIYDIDVSADLRSIALVSFQSGSYPTFIKSY